MQDFKYAAVLLLTFVGLAVLLWLPILAYVLVTWHIAERMHEFGKRGGTFW